MLGVISEQVFLMSVFIFILICLWMYTKTLSTIIKMHQQCTKDNFMRNSLKILTTVHYISTGIFFLQFKNFDDGFIYTGNFFLIYTGNVIWGL